MQLSEWWKMNWTRIDNLTIQYKLQMSILTLTDNKHEIEGGNFFFTILAMF